MWKFPVYLFLTILFLSSCATLKKKKSTFDWIADTYAEKPPSPLVKKYAKYLEVPPDSLKNEALYGYIDQWLGTPYVLGGNGERGIDCSALVQNLYVDVYQTLMPRTSETQFRAKQVYLFRNQKYLKEGDLLFFRLNQSEPISHVGVYLHNNKFVHSTRHKGDSKFQGVKISDLSDSYWQSLYVSGGKVKRTESKVSAK